MIDPRTLDDDDDAWLVYADALQAAGDPRGELIVVQQRLQAAPDDAELRALHDELVEEHDFAGPIGGSANPFGTGERAYGVELEWRRGFVRRMRVRQDVPDLGPILSHPSYRLLETLALAEPEPGREQQYAEHYVAPVVETGPHESLRELVIGPHIERGPEWAGGGYVYIDVDISAQYLGRLGPLWKAVPALERLAVIGNAVDFGTLVLPELRVFEHLTSSLGRAELSAIRRATWPKLERLEVWFGDGEYGGGDCTVKDINALLVELPKGAPNLRELAIANCPNVNELLPFLKSAPILQQLSVLDLSHGNLSKKGATTLSKIVKELPHLKVLNVAASPIDEAALAPLRKAAPHLEILAGRLSPGRGRYTAVSE